LTDHLRSAFHFDDKLISSLANPSPKEGIAHILNKLSVSLTPSIYFNRHFDSLERMAREGTGATSVNGSFDRKPETNWLPVVGFSDYPAKLLH